MKLRDNQARTLAVDLLGVEDALHCFHDQNASDQPSAQHRSKGPQHLDAVIPAAYTRLNYLTWLAASELRAAHPKVCELWLFLVE